MYDTSQFNLVTVRSRFCELRGKMDLVDKIENSQK